MITKAINVSKIWLNGYTNTYRLTWSRQSVHLHTRIIYAVESANGERKKKKAN